MISHLSFNIVQKCIKNAIASFRPKFWKVGLSQKNENYMSNECILFGLLFGIDFSTFCENNTCQNLSQNGAIKYKWHNFWYLEFLFQVNVFIGCI